MLDMFLYSYFTIFLATALGAFIIFTLGVYFILKKNYRTPTQPPRQPTRTPANENVIDIHTIAGDDVLSTRLDLARAFIEVNKPHSAKKILQAVLKTGTPDQQEEAKRLLASISV